MITCENCGTVQKESKFCGYCGALLQVSTSKVEEVKSEAIKKEDVDIESTIQTEEGYSEANPTNFNLDEQGNKKSIQTGAYKEKITNYWNYFVACIKNPTQNTGEENFIFGLISTLIALLLFVLTPFMLINKLISSIYSGINSIFDVSNTSTALEFSTYIKMLLYIGVFYAVILAITFILAKNLGKLSSWKAGIAQIGAYNNFISVLSLVLLLFIFLNSIQLVSILFTFISLLFILLLPLYLAVTNYKVEHKIDSFLRFLITFAAYTIVCLIAYEIFFANIFSELTNILTTF